MRIVLPFRRTYEFVQHLDGSADDVFPLLCPVRECDWIPGWDPGLVVTASGVAEAGCIFTTRDVTASSGAEREAVWVVVSHDPHARTVAMVKVSPNFVVTRLWIAVLPGEKPGRSEAHVRYEYTALSQEGEDFLGEHTPANWVAFMEQWENCLNAHLRAWAAGR